MSTRNIGWIPLRLRARSKLVIRRSSTTTRTKSGRLALFTGAWLSTGGNLTNGSRKGGIIFLPSTLRVFTFRFTPPKWSLRWRPSKHTLERLTWWEWKVLAGTTRQRGVRCRMSVGTTSWVVDGYLLFLSTYTSQSRRQMARVREPKKMT